MLLEMCEEVLVEICWNAWRADCLTAFGRGNNLRNQSMEGARALLSLGATCVFFRERLRHVTAREKHLLPDRKSGFRKLCLELTSIANCCTPICSFVGEKREFGEWTKQARLEKRTEDRVSRLLSCDQLLALHCADEHCARSRAEAAQEEFAALLRPTTIKEDVLALATGRDGSWVFAFVVRIGALGEREHWLRAFDADKGMLVGCQKIKTPLEEDHLYEVKLQPHPHRPLAFVRWFVSNQGRWAHFLIFDVSRKKPWIHKRIKHHAGISTWWDARADQILCRFSLWPVHITHNETGSRIVQPVDSALSVYDVSAGAEDGGRVATFRAFGPRPQDRKFVSEGNNLDVVPLKRTSQDVVYYELSPAGDVLAVFFYDEKSTVLYEDTGDSWTRRDKIDMSLHLLKCPAKGFEFLAPVIRFSGCGRYLLFDALPSRPPNRQATAAMLLQVQDMQGTLLICDTRASQRLRESASCEDARHVLCRCVFGKPFDVFCCRKRMVLWTRRGFLVLD